MNDFRARLFEEFDQLGKRTDRLKEFCLTDKFDSLPEIERNDLREQLKHMQAYWKVLSHRVSRQCGNA